MGKGQGFILLQMEYQTFSSKNDKPMIYYFYQHSMMADVREILLISTERDLETFKTLLGDGSKFGIKLEYIIQDSGWNCTSIYSC